ncbi:MAG: hypothetical protein JW716_01115 [Candidatus Aenigmarchaeota archaeon]|nr:hypothetical protein [Candidatus Aenigmarchaeota archaeon]
MRGITRNLLVFSLILAVALAVFAGANGVIADGGSSPTPPADYYGTLKINGVNAPAGTHVKALIDGADKTSGSYSTTAVGQYGAAGLGVKFYVDAPSEDNGKEVVFMVEKTPGSGQYAEANEKGTYLRSTSTNLALTVTYDEDCTNGETRPCYTGPAGTQDVGICHAGTETCVGTSWSGVCVGEQTPETELCDGIDNNCDGTADDAFPNLGNACSAGIGACYAEGQFVCNGAQTGTECDAVAGAPVAETCNGIDDDCNGVIDNGLGQTTCGLGVCEHTVDNCIGGVPQFCDPFEGQLAENSAETCDDGLDNDCDGFADCADIDCSDECGGSSDYCITINDVRILNANFDEVTSILPGRMYNVEVTNENTCEYDVQTMQIVEIFRGSTPKNIGTVTAIIDAGETSTITVGFTMPNDATPGTAYTAKVFNWNHWIDQSPGTFQILSEPAEEGFTVGA